MDCASVGAGGSSGGGGGACSSHRWGWHVERMVGTWAMHGYAMLQWISIQHRMFAYVYSIILSTPAFDWGSSRWTFCFPHSEDPPDFIWRFKSAQLKFADSKSTPAQTPDSMFEVPRARVWQTETSPSITKEDSSGSRQGCTPSEMVGDKESGTKSLRNKAARNLLNQFRWLLNIWEEQALQQLDAALQQLDAARQSVSEKSLQLKELMHPVLQNLGGGLWGLWVSGLFFFLLLCKSHAPSLQSWHTRTASGAHLRHQRCKQMDSYTPCGMLKRSWDYTWNYNWRCNWR